MRGCGTILIVEDSPEDFETTVRAFRRSALDHPVAHCADGDDALDYLYRRGRHAGRAPGQPELILLDLNLPGTDGREVLDEIKRDPELVKIPVIVLTTSVDSRDIESCYRSGANSYVQKPVDLDGFMGERLKEYWFETAILPEFG